MIPSVNFHLWEPCNMRCQFCFATFQDVKKSILPKGHLTQEDANSVVLELADMGFEKITFAGGEPTLCPWLHELIRTAKIAGMTTMIVSNGSNLTDEFLSSNRPFLDWVALSVDSIEDEMNIAAGRAILAKRPITGNRYFQLVDNIKSHGYGLKINTVIHSLNYSTDMSAFIEFSKPKRWKILQVLPIKGQNDGKVDSLSISDDQFLNFVHRHQAMNRWTEMIPESNWDMKGSYAMVDPAGRFFDNAEGTHRYSHPILKIGGRLAIQEVAYDYDKFVARKGFYEWAVSGKTPSKITLSGQVASGKSLIGQLLAEKLNFKFISIGNRTRQYAAEMGLSINEFQQRCAEDPSMDTALDANFSKECNNGDNLVIDYRLGFMFVANAFHVYLNVSEEVAIERLKNAGRPNETHATLVERNNSFKSQFESAYDVDYTAEKHYDLILDVNEKSEDEIVQEILKKIGVTQAQISNSEA